MELGEGLEGQGGQAGVGDEPVDGEQEELEARQPRDLHHLAVAHAVAALQAEPLKPMQQVLE